MTNYCKFITYGQLFKCQECGYETKFANLQRDCKPLTVPNPVTRLANFAKAAAQHELNGRPTCTEKQVKERLAVCERCELFKLAENGVGGLCTHSSCGCTIRDEVAYFNKLAWADQKCPLDKWGPIDPNSTKTIENGV